MRNSGIGRSAGRLSPLALALLVVALLLGTTGGAVAGALITGAQIKNGTVTGADIKDGSLTKADTADEPISWGAQSNTTTNDFTTNTYTPIVTKNLTAPRAGFLTVAASLYAEDDEDLVGKGRLYYAVRIDGKDYAKGTLWYSGADGDYTGENGSLNAVIPVAKGAHKVQLVVLVAGAGSYLYGGRITALYTAAGSSSGFSPFTRPVTPRTQR